MANWSSNKFDANILKLQAIKSRDGETVTPKHVATFKHKRDDLFARYLNGG